MKQSHSDTQITSSAGAGERWSWNLYLGPSQEENLRCLSMRWESPRLPLSVR